MSIKLVIIDEDGKQHLVAGNLRSFALEPALGSMPSLHDEILRVLKDVERARRELIPSSEPLICFHLVEPESVAYHYPVQHLGYKCGPLLREINVIAQCSPSSLTASIRSISEDCRVHTGRSWQRPAEPTIMRPGQTVEEFLKELSP